MNKNNNYLEMTIFINKNIFNKIFYKEMPFYYLNILKIFEINKN